MKTAHKLLLAGVLLTSTSLASADSVLSISKIASHICQVDAQIERKIVDGAWAKKPISYKQAEKLLAQELEKAKNDPVERYIPSLMSSVLRSFTAKSVSTAYSPKYAVTGVSKANGLNIVHSDWDNAQEYIGKMNLEQFKQYYIQSTFNACNDSVSKALRSTQIQGISWGE